MSLLFEKVLQRGGRIVLQLYMFEDVRKEFRRDFAENVSFNPHGAWTLFLAILRHSTTSAIVGHLLAEDRTHFTANTATGGSQQGPILGFKTSAKSPCLMIGMAPSTTDGEVVFLVNGVSPAQNL
ncbi:hypothetical protein COP2_003597 [Malus domestica]